MSLFQTTAFTSYAVQIATGLLEFTGLLTPVKAKDQIVKQLLASELFIQLIEFSFYTYLIYTLTLHPSYKVKTYKRYTDWSLTTPIMLVNFALFFKYLTRESKGESQPTFWESAREELPTLLPIILANFLMLLVGFLGEVGSINLYLAVAVGFLPFAFMFKQLYSNYVETFLSKIVFYAIFSIWGLYGVAATLDYELKNSAYNIIDLFSKNAFGLFLYFYVRRLEHTSEDRTTESKNALQIPLQP